MTNPENHIFSIKRFAGRKHDEVAQEIARIPHQVVGAAPIGSLLGPVDAQAVAALEQAKEAVLAVRVLLDGCLPRRLKRELVGHEVRTAPEMGSASKTNGKLLTLAASEFDVFLASDRNLSHQQNVSAFATALVVLIATSNRIEEWVTNAVAFDSKPAREIEERMRREV